MPHRAFIPVAIVCGLLTACSDSPASKANASTSDTGRDAGIISGSPDASGTITGPGGCPVVRDAFDQLDDMRWRVLDSTGWDIQTNGVLNVIPEEIQNTRNFVMTTRQQFDLTGCATWTEVVRLSPDEIRGEVLWVVEVTSQPETRVIFSKSSPQLGFVVVDDGETTQSNVPYDAPEHRWWRVRDDASTLFVETSPDAEQWTVQIEHPHDWDLSAVDFRLVARTTAISEVFDGPQFDNAHLPALEYSALVPSGRCGPCPS